MHCPVCEKQAENFFCCKDHEFGKNEIKIFRCSFCKTLFVDKKTIGLSLSKYYAQSYYERMGFLSKFLQVLRAKKFSSIKTGNVLDVGCGSGFFLEKMRQKGWNASGQEVSASSKPFYKKLEAAGIRFFYGNLQDISFEEKFDLVTLFHVIEHIDDPLPLLMKIKKLLKKNGLLFVATPNAGSASMRLFGCKWFHLDPPRHLIIYSVKSLVGLLESNGFKVLKVSRFSFEYDPFGLAQSFYNFLGVEFNFLYKVLKRKKTKSGAIKQFIFKAAVIFSIVPLFSLSVFFSFLLGFFSMQDTTEVYAIKK